MPRRSSSYETLRTVEEIGQIGVWTWTTAGDRLTWSAGLYRILGVDPSEAPSFGLYRSLIHPEDRLATDDPHRLLSDRAALSRKHRIIRPDGRLRWMVGRAEIIHGPDGDPAEVVGIVRDVTTEEEARLAAEAADRRLEAVSGLLGVEVWTTRADGSAADAEGWQRKTGLASADAAGWGRLQAVHPDDRDLVRRAWTEAVEGGERYEARYRLRTTAGDYRVVHSRGVPQRGRTGAVEWWIGVCSDDPVVTAAAGSGGLTCRTQLRAARAFLDWSSADLARAAGVSLSTVRRAEADGPAAIGPQALRAIEQALQRAGIGLDADLAGNRMVVLRGRDSGAESAAGT